MYMRWTRATVNPTYYYRRHYCYKIYIYIYTYFIVIIVAVGTRRVRRRLVDRKPDAEKRAHKTIIVTAVIHQNCPGYVCVCVCLYLPVYSPYVCLYSSVRPRRSSYLGITYTFAQRIRDDVFLKQIVFTVSNVAGTKLRLLLLLLLLL